MRPGVWAILAVLLAAAFIVSAWFLVPAAVLALGMWDMG
jgi:hypothetical protein